MLVALQFVIPVKCVFSVQATPVALFPVSVLVNVLVNVNVPDGLSKFPGRGTVFFWLDLKNRKS